MVIASGDTMTTISWYGLRVAPQTELKVQRILHQREFPALAPVELVRRVREREADKPKVTVKREKPVFPGYVFLGLNNPADIVAEREFINLREGRPVIFGLLGLTRERPSILSPSDVVFLMTISSQLEAQSPLNVLQVGDKVKFRDGHAFEGKAGPVVKLRGRERAKVSVMLKVFDGMRVVETTIENLVAA